jgi:Glyoxalase-like domain
MAVRFQLVIDCASPEPLARFWAAALGYQLEPSPDGFATWDDYWRDFGVPESDLGLGTDCIIDPDGRGPRVRLPEPLITTAPGPRVRLPEPLITTAPGPRVRLPEPLVPPEGGWG